MGLNPDKDHVNKILEALKKNGGYCPCVFTKSPDTICKCKEYRETKVCHCGLFMDRSECENPKTGE